MFDDTREAALIDTVRSAARARILPRFRALVPGEIRTKSGPGDLVTLADTEAEAQITAAMRHFWPGAEVLGEEAVAADKALRARMGEAEWAVVIDPVDGTWNFAKGLAVFGVIAAVLHHGRPLWGMLYDPIMDDWIVARAEGETRMAARGGVQALATSAESRGGRLTGYLPVGLFPKAQQARLGAQLADFARATSLRCACHEYRMLAQGHVEFCLSGPTPHPWDHAAGVVCVERAGGVVRFLDGSPYDARRTRGVLLAAASQTVWDDLAGRFAWLA